MGANPKDSAVGISCILNLIPILTQLPG